MNAGRLWRTVRHLSAEQWIFRFVCRGRLALMQRRPAAARARIDGAAAALPLPDPGRAEIAAIADIALALQTAVHGETFAGAPQGKFRLLNRDYDFGSIDEIDWRGDFHEGANPLRRMVLAYMGYAVPLLATGAPENLAAVAHILRTLDACNPWSGPGVLRDVWNAYTASHRSINLLSGLALYRRAGGRADPASEGPILDHVRMCAAFVRRTLERDIQFNHLMKNLTALTVYAAACDRAPRDFAFLKDAVPRAVRQNVLADGGHAERSPMYHALGLLDVRMLAASGLFTDSWRPLLGETQGRMETALAAMMLADGDIALFNDSWIGEAPPASALVDRPSPGVGRLPETGYVRLAGDGENAGDSVVFDSGPCGPDENPGHAHADFLSVEATVGGTRFLVDTGVPTYTAGTARDASRSAAAHNGPRLVGAEPIEFWKSFRVGRRGQAAELDTGALSGLAPMVAAARQSGYAPLGVDVRRLVALWPGEGLLIADLWLGAEPARARSGFLVPAEWQSGKGERFALDGRVVSVDVLAGAPTRPEPAAHWLRFDVERPAHRLEIDAAAISGGARAAVFFAWGDRPPPGPETLESLFDRLGAARTRQRHSG